MNEKNMKYMAEEVMKTLETHGRTSVPRPQIEALLAALGGMDTCTSTTTKCHTDYTSSTVYMRSDSGYILAILAPRYSDGDLTVDLYLTHLTPQAYERLLGR